MVVVLAVLQFLGLFGYLGGFFDRNVQGRLIWHAYHWDTATILYTILMWGAWAVVMSILLLSKESPKVKFGASVLLSFPVAVFVFLFFEWIQLGPR